MPSKRPDQEVIFATAAPLPEAKQAWSRCEALVAESRALRHEDKTRMLAFAQRAVTVAETLTATIHGTTVCDLQAWAWAELGNACRVGDDLAAAERAMARALDRWSAGTGDPLVLARLMELSASLCTDQRRFEDALALLDRVELIYQEHDDGERTGRALIKKGIYCGYQADAAEALRLLYAGLGEIDPTKDPALTLSAVDSLLWFLVDLGRFKVARRLLWDVGRLCTEVGGRINLIKFRWLEARIHAGVGDLERAERAFRDVRERFAREALPFNGALAALDLGELYLRQGRTAATAELLEEVLGTFRALRIGREAIAAILLLREALREEVPSLALFRGVANFLKGFEQRQDPRRR